MDNVIIAALVGLAVFILVFLILREVMCWYWKINERITLQQQTNALLKKLIDSGWQGTNLSAGAPVSTATGDAASKASKPSASTSSDANSAKEGSTLFCTNCGKENLSTARFCVACGTSLAE